MHFLPPRILEQKRAGFVTYHPPSSRIPFNNMYIEMTKCTQSSYPNYCSGKMHVRFNRSIETAFSTKYDEQLELLSMPGTKVTLRAYNLAERFVLLSVVAIPGVNISSLGRTSIYPIYPGSNLLFPQVKGIPSQCSLTCLS